MLMFSNMDYFLKYKDGYTHGPINCDFFLKTNCH